MSYRTMLKSMSKHYMVHLVIHHHLEKILNALPVHFFQILGH